MPLATTYRGRIRFGTVDGQRNFITEDQEPRWYAAERGHAESDRRGAGEDRYPAPDYRGPGQRGGPAGESRYGAGAERYGDDPLGGGERFGERFGDPEPGRGAESLRTDDPIRPRDVPTGPMQSVGVGPAEAEPPHFHTAPLDRAALRRPAGPGAPLGDGVYRTRRPAVAVIFALLAVIFEVPALRVLLDGATNDPVSPTGVVSGTLLVIGLPVFAAGLYALASGAGGTDPGRFWSRPPTAYVTVGLALFVAAALAA